MSYSKKAIMAIGTLIIFIAMILISAIVAGFLIGITGILQQRSSYVAKDAENRLTSGLELVSMMAYSDSYMNSLNNYELLVRLSPGSDPINIRNFNLIFNTESDSYAITLQDPIYSTYSSIEVSSLNLGDSENIIDIDYDGSEEIVSLVRYNNDSVVDNSLVSGPTYLVFNFSNFGGYEISLGDLSDSYTSFINFNDYPIFFENRTYGFIHQNKKFIENDIFPEFTITEFPKKCSFDTIISEEFFCFQTQIGNTNDLIEKGEMFKIRFKISENLKTDSNYELQLVPKTGSIQRIKGTIPSVLVLKQVVLYP